MMKLYWSPRSPFVRKVMITLHETGLIDEVETVRSVVASTLPPNAEVLEDNPLGKIPTLVTEDGVALFDSRVICEYLDLRTGTGLFPAEPAARMRQLRWQAMADGLTDILLAWRSELTRTVGPWPELTSAYGVKVRATMARFEREAAELGASSFGIGQISLVCALGQLDFRWPDCGWRDGFPTLARWSDELRRRPSVQATSVADDQADDGTALTASILRF
jgi:glutathione S-transferase